MLLTSTPSSVDFSHSSEKGSIRSFLSNYQDQNMKFYETVPEHQCVYVCVHHACHSSHRAAGLWCDWCDWTWSTLSSTSNKMAKNKYSPLGAMAQRDLRRLYWVCFCAGMCVNAAMSFIVSTMGTNRDVPSPHFGLLFLQKDVRIHHRLTYSQYRNKVDSLYVF